MGDNETTPPSGASPGRPPRAPQVPQPPVTPPPASQREFLAALQQSDEGGVQAFATSQRALPSPCLVQPSPGIKKPDHSRTVSWGISSGHSPTRPPPPHGGSNRNHLPSWDGSTLSGTKLDVNDVINTGGQTEMEAETYILRAVEKITIQAHQRTNTEVSGLYSTIVSQELLANDTFETEEEEEEVGHEDDKPKPRPIPTKQVSHSTLNSGNWKPINHNRLKSDTVEGTLFGLTTALEELDDTIERSDSQLEDEAEVPETTFTSADKLATAAQKMLSDDKPNDKPNDVEANVGTPGKGVTGKKGNKFRPKLGRNRVVRGAKGASDGVKQEWQLFDNFFKTRKDKIKAYIRRLLVAIVLPSFLLAFFLFYVVENPDLCPLPKANRTVSPTLPPTAAPSWAPSSSPSLEPSVYPSQAPSEFEDPFLISWFGNDTVMLSDTNSTATVTLAPTTNETQAPLEVEEEEPEEEEEEESIFDAIAIDFRVCPGAGASASWWILFLGVRNVITFSLAAVTQAVVIDYLALSSRILLSTVGPIFTLLVVQSKGWPFLLVFWAIYNLILLCGDKPYHHHWMYWQDWLGIFNEENPSGNVVSNPWNQRILVNAIIVGVLVAVKRFLLGLFLGRQTFAHYGEKLAEVMKNMVLVGEVATLAKHIENTKEDYQYLQEDYRDHLSAQGSVGTSLSNGWNSKNLRRFVQEAEDTDGDEDEPLTASAADAAKNFMASRQVAPKSPDAKSVLSASSYESVISPDADFTESQQKEMAELLDAWEDPQTEEEKEEKKITIGSVLSFRQALAFMKKKYPFLPAFGPADTREACIQSAQQVYDRLLLRTPHLGVLPFETLALLAKKEDGSIDKEKAKELIRAFRPDRDGTLGKLEWVKSVDVIYKDLRLLAANISNSSQMDAAVESLVNIVFYIALGAIIIYRLGEDPLDLFLSFSSVILAFAFMFGKSGAKYFDGCLFILVQRPYGVGDRVHLSNPQNETSPDGSSGWIVEKVSLFTTSVYWGATNERATLCNGAISNLRVINAARSPNAIVFVELKFGIETPYEKIEIFRTAVEQFLKDRPREWLTFVGFRPSEVAPEKGFIGYKVIAQHRNSWQAVGGIIESRANLTTYCLEVAKQLEMRFHAPPLPVHLTMKDADGLAMPTLGESAGDDEAKRGFADASAMSPLGPPDTGLRHRRVKSKFADLVAKALEASKKHT